MSVILNPRSVILSLPRAANCKTVVVRDLNERTAVIMVGCAGGNCGRCVDLCQQQGTYLQYARTVNDQDGNALDISTSAILFRIYTGVAGTLLLDRSTAGGTMTRSSNSRVQWEIDSEDSLALALGSHYYEFWVTDSAGERYLSEYGTFKVQDTRSFDA